MICVMSLVLTCGIALGANGKLIFPNSDFEKGDLTNWVKDGNAFDFQPTLGDNPSARHWREPSNHQGRYWIGTYEKYNGKNAGRPGMLQTDRPQGTLTSIPFVITHSEINFLVGGGSNKDKEYVALEVDGSVVRKATGQNCDTMKRTTWDVKEFAGKQGKIIIVDRDSGGRGHINADDFRFSGRKVADIQKDNAHEAGTPEPVAPVPGTPATDTAPATAPPHVSGEHAPAGTGTRPDVPGAASQKYEKWFPAAPQGWTAGRAEVLDSKQMLQVKKDYTYRARKARLTIYVAVNRFVPLENAVQNEKNYNETVNKLAAMSDTMETVKRQGHVGMLTDEGGTSDLTFSIGGEALIIDLSATPRDKALLLKMARRIDIEQAIRLFLHDNQEAASR